MSFILSPSETLYYLGSGEPKIALSKVQGYISQPNILAIFNHKKLTIYNIQKIAETFAKQQYNIPRISEVDFNKKVEVLSFVNDNLIVSDKYGDIFSVNNQIKVFLNENFSIPTLIHYVEAEKDKLFIVGDEYSKLKVFNFNNPHQIFSVWTPFEATPLQMVTIKNTIVYLVKVNKKDTVDCKYALYTINIDNLKNQVFPGVQIKQFQSEFADNHLTKLVSNGQNVYIVSLRPGFLNVDHFKLKQSLTKVSSVLSKINSFQWQYLDISYSNELYIYLGRQTSKQQNSSNLQIEQGFKIISQNQNEYFVSLKI